MVLLRKGIPRRKVALSLTLYDAFDAAVGTRETDQTLRAITRRAWRAYFARLMPVWAGVLTFATVVFGLPGLVLLAQALAPVFGNAFETMDVARSSSPLALGLTGLAAPDPRPLRIGEPRGRWCLFADAGSPAPGGRCAPVVSVSLRRHSPAQAGVDRIAGGPAPAHGRDPARACGYDDRRDR